MLPTVRTGSLNDVLGRCVQRSASANGISRSPDVARVRPARVAPLANAVEGGSDDRFEILKQNSQIQPFEVRDDLLIFELPNRAGVLGVCRSGAARDRSPERLHLDRLKLPSCPVLEKEGKLKMLSYQNNSISRIENLESLRQLVFLDLYGNKVEQVENLDVVPNLRVLMLGKNQISRIQNLEMVTKLDVLDLHSNRITSIEKVEHLKELRVLNLAGNSIQIVQNIESLVSLTELNLRRNFLTSLDGISVNSSLQHIFASRNQLSTFDGLESLRQLGRLSELALDGNPVCNLPSYQSHVFDLCPSLLLLDGHRNGDTKSEEVNTSKNILRDTSSIDEARHSLASSTLAELKCKELDPALASTVTANGDVSSVSYRGNSAQVEKRGQESSDQDQPFASGTFAKSIVSGSLRLPGSESKRPPSASRISGGNAATRNRPGSIQPPKSKSVTGGAKSRPSSAGTGGRVQEEPLVGMVGRQTASRVSSVDRRASTQAQPIGSKPDEQNKAVNNNNNSSGAQKQLSSSDVLREIRSQWMEAIASGRTPSIRYGYVRREQANELAVYGRGLEALDKPEYQSVITSIHFNFITISSVLLDTSRLLKFQGLNSIVFSRNQIFSFDQLEALQQLPTLTSLTIVDNPICEMYSSLRMHAIRSLPGLQTFNNKEISEAERQLTSQVFAPFDQLSRSSNLVKSGDIDKKRPQIANLVDELTSHACVVDEKLRVVHSHFEIAVREAIREAWDDAFAMSGMSQEDVDSLHLP